MLERGRPYEREDVRRVIELVAEDGQIERVLDEATERLRVAEKAAARIPEGELTPILHSLGRYLLDRVESARG